MDIVIIADFCGSFDEKSNNRFVYLAQLLSKDDDVEILTSDFSHETKSSLKFDPKRYPFKVTLIHEPCYSKNISLKRFYAHHVWGKNVYDYFKHRKKPDIVYCAIPPLTAAYRVSKYCQKKNIPFILDIQDLWPEAFRMFFDMPVVSDILFAPLLLLENKICQNADAICAVSNSYVERALKVNKKSKKGLTVFLGTDFSTFDTANIRTSYSKAKDDLWIGYCGSMSDCYDLSCVIDALAKIDHPPVLIAMGDGAKRNQFQEYARKKDVKALFTGQLPYEEMCTILKMCDFVINPIKYKSAQSIINKHADYAASGLPVINTQECIEYRSLVESYNMGVNCKNGDADDVAQQISFLTNNPELRYSMGKNARRCGEDLFNRLTTYSKIKKLIYEMTKNP